MNSNKFDGNKLFEIRRSKKISQSKLASLVGVTRQSIYLWEANQTIPDIEKVRKICMALEIDINELFNEDNNNETNLKENEDINNSVKQIETKTFDIEDKYKSKNKIFMKIIGIIIIIFMIIYFIFSTIKFIRLNKILDKWEELDRFNNYYIKIEEYLVDNNNLDIVSESLFYEKYYNNGILKTIVKDRKNEEIINIIICDYINGNKYIIYEDTKTYRIEKIAKNKDAHKLSSNFASFSKLKGSNKFINYITCFNFNFKISKKEEYEIIKKDYIKEKIDIETGLLEYEETLDNNFRKYKRHYKIEPNTKKDFEINLDEYTEIKEN